MIQISKRYNYLFIQKYNLIRKPRNESKGRFYDKDFALSLQKRIFMLRKIAILTIILSQVVFAQAQEIKFGVHIDPFISLMDSDYSKVEGAAVNGGGEIGVEIEYRFSDNYALTFGVDFALNRGGSLLYKYGGVILPNTDFDNRSSFEYAGGTTILANAPVDMMAFTKINYRLNYVELPIGLKLRTNELGGSYLRAFFHIPLIKIGIPVTAGAKVFSPDATADGFEDDRGTGKVHIPQSDGSIVEPNVWKDITPIQISIGAGAGVEYTPNQDGGLRIYAGFYYTAGIIDVTGGIPASDIAFTAAQTPSNLTPETQNRNPRNGLHNIALRIGVIF